MKNEDQIKFWNGEMGEKWVQRADDLDAMLEPFRDAVLNTAAPKSGESLLDIGCGAGALTMAAANFVGPTKGAKGVDISEPLVALAKRRAQERSLPADFEVADAADYRAPGAADIVVSRFGVMFFDDPTAAFANIRESVAPEGRLVFACWQSVDQNQWAFQAVQCAIPHLREPLPEPDPLAPGPFAFADKDRVNSILSDAGWREVQIRDWRNRMALPGGTPENVADFLMEIGPLARLLKEQDIDPEIISQALAEELKETVDEDGAVAQEAATWIVTARNPQ